MADSKTDLAPMPNETPLQEECNLCSILLTSYISKVLKYSVAEWILEDIRVNSDHALIQNNMIAFVDHPPQVGSRS